MDELEILVVRPIQGTVLHAKQRDAYIAVKKASLGYGAVDARVPSGSKIKLEPQPFAVRTEAQAARLMESLQAAVAAGTMLGIDQFEIATVPVPNATEISWPTEAEVD